MDLSPNNSVSLDNVTFFYGFAFLFYKMKLHDLYQPFIEYSAFLRNLDDTRKCQIWGANEGDMDWWGDWQKSGLPVYVKS